MNVVDALVMTLGLDTRDYEKGQKRAEAGLSSLSKQSNAVAKQMMEDGKKAAQFFSSVKIELMGLLAMLGVSTGLKDFIESNVKGQASLGRLAASLDMSGKRLEGWGQTARQMGDDATVAYGALETVASGLAEAAITGHSALTDTARKYGIVIKAGESYEQVLVSISARMQGMSREKAKFMANELGVGGMFNELALGPTELLKRVAAAEAKSRVTPESIAAAQRLQMQWADIKQSFTQISQTAFIKIWPQLEKVTKRFAKWLESVDWDKVANGIANFASRVDDLVQKLGGWGVVATALGVILALNVLSPILSMVGALTLLIPLLSSAAAGVGALGAAGTTAGALGTAGVRALGTAGLRALGTAGLWGLGAAGAAYGGWKIGKYLNLGLEDTAAGVGIGAAVATVLANFGNTTAQDALTSNVMGYAQKDFRTKGKPNAGASSKGGSGNAALFAGLEAQYGLDAGLIQSIFMKESGGGKYLLSPKGAKGPFQFMDATARQYGLRGNDVMDLEKSARAMARYMSDLKKQFGGNTALAVAAYNAGPGTVKKYGGVPPYAETQNYVRSVMSGLGPQSRGGSRTSTSTSETNIGQITVNTQATDARGIAQGIKGAIKDNALVAAYETGTE